MSAANQRHQRATDLDRTMVSSLLDKAHGEGQLTPKEHERRVSAAGNATTRGDLLALVEDLQTERPAFAPPSPTRGHAHETQNRQRTYTGVPSMRDTRHYVKKFFIVMGWTVAVTVILAVAAVISNTRDSDSGSSSSDSNGNGEEIESDIYVGTGADPAVPADRLEVSLWSDYMDSQGTSPQDISCDTDLPAEVDSRVECTVENEDSEQTATVTVIDHTEDAITYSVSFEEAN